MVKSHSHDEAYRQLTLFDLVEDRSRAVNMMSGRLAETSAPEDWMKRLVPTGELVVMVGEHPMVLSPTGRTESEIRPEMRYCHYTVAGVVYSGIFVGREVA